MNYWEPDYEKKYQSKILQAIHEDAKGMHKLGIINDSEMREFDNDCFLKEPEPIYKTARSKSRLQSSSAETKHNVRISAKGAGS